MRLGDVVRLWREDVEDEAPAGHEGRPRRLESFDALSIVIQVEIRAERTDDERHLLVERRVPQVAQPQVEELRDAGCLGAPPAGSDHLAGRVDADHALSLLGDRDRDPSGADAELHDGSAGLPRLGDVEADVLGDAPTPRVVELGDRVVRRRAHPGFLATHTNSLLFSSNGVRSKSP